MRYCALAPVTFLRGYARELGMAWGIFRVFVFEGLQGERLNGRA